MLVLAMERSRGGRTAARGSEPVIGPLTARSTISGDHGGGATPVPIPNTAVKPASADGTWGETPWESRTSPGYFDETGPCESGGPSPFQTRRVPSAGQLAGSVGRAAVRSGPRSTEEAR